MANRVADYSAPTIGLSVTPAGTSNFTLPILLIDDENVPFDRVYRTFTSATYASSFTAGTAAYLWLSSLWAQTKGGPSVAYVGRWAKVASAAYCVCPDATAVASVYAALAATAKFKLVEGASNEDISPNFTGDTSMADVCASIQTALGLSTLGAAYTCALDDLSRIVITSDNTGSTAAAVSIATPATGVDLTGAAYLGSSFAQAGFDAEAPETALARILALNNTPFAIAESGCSIAQQVSLSVYVNALNKFLFLRVVDTDAKSAVATTDSGYQINALGHNQTRALYTEHTSQYPDAANIGEILAYKEGEMNHGLWPMTGLSMSGLHVDGTTVIPMTDDEESALSDKGYDWIVKPSNVTHFDNGLTCNGTEARVIIGKMFIEAKIAESWYAYLVAQKVVTFSDSDIEALGQMAKYWLDVAVSRKLLDPDYTISLPLASSFTAAVKATHIMDLPNFSTADVQIAVNKITGDLNWNV